MTTQPSELQSVVRRFIQDFGHTTQSFGLGRNVGQVYAYLYFSQGARSLSDMQHTLGISKGSASMTVRQLEQWGAVQKIWVRGDRRDYYEASDWFGRIIKNAVLESFAKRMEAYGRMIAGAESEIAKLGGGNGEAAFVRTRIVHLKDFQAKAQKVWRNPLLQRLLK